MKSLAPPLLSSLFLGSAACAPKAEDTSEWSGELEDPTACFHREVPASTGTPAVVGTTAFASADERAPCGRAAGPELRYRWRPDESRSYRIHTGGTEFDTVLYVFEGCTRRPVACNDDHEETLQSLVAFDAEAGAPYIVVIDGFEPYDRGPFQLTIQ